MGGTDLGEITSGDIFMIGNSLYFGNKMNKLINYFLYFGKLPMEIKPTASLIPSGTWSLLALK